MSVMSITYVMGTPCSCLLQSRIHGWRRSCEAALHSWCLRPRRLPFSQRAEAPLPNLLMSDPRPGPGKSWLTAMNIRRRTFGLVITKSSEAIFWMDRETRLNDGVLKAPSVNLPRAFCLALARPTVA